MLKPKYISMAFACAVVLMAPASSFAEGDKGDVLVTARAALEDGFYEIAEEQFRAWLEGRHEPELETMEVLNLYCRALDGQGKTKEVRKVVNTGAPSKLQVSNTPMADYWLAYCDYREDNFAGATNVLAAFDTNHVSDAYSPQALRLKGWCLLGLGRTNQAVDAFIEFEKKFTSHPARVRNLTELGELLFKTGDNKRAEKYLRKVADIEGMAEAGVRAHHLLGSALKSLGKGQEAREVFTGVAKAEGLAGDIRAEAFLEAAEIGASTGDLAGAISSCVEALKLTRNPDLQMRGSILHGRTLIDAGKLKEGIAILKGQVVKMTDHVQSSELQLEVARSLLESDKDREAVEEYQLYLETFTNAVGLVDAHLGKGWGMFRLERFAEAAAEFQKVYEMSERAALKEESLYKMGDAYFANGQYKLALDAYDAFLKEFPESGKVKSVSYQRAEALLGGGSVKEAEAQFAKVAQDYPQEDLGAEALLKIGKIKFDRKEVAAAVADFEVVMKRFPRKDYFVRALHSRAKTHFSAGNFEGALSDLARITSKHAGSSSAQDALYEMGICYHRMGRNQDVEKTFAELLQKYPDSKWAPDVVFWQGEKEFNSGEMKKAEGVFLEFVEKYPKSVLVPEALLRAGMAASGRKEYVRAIELFNRLAKEYPNSVRIPDARFAQANALCELGRFSEAILPLDEIINKYPESALVMPAWGRKGDCHFTMGVEDPTRYEESIQCYRVVVASSKSSRSMVLQSEYKIGRSLEKMGKASDALERYYSRVMIPFLEQKKKGEKHDESARVWFTRASLDAARILESQQDWKRAANVLERLEESGVPASKEAGARARKIRSEHWWLFY